MKKPKLRRLVLHRETLRPLLTGVVGGDTIIGCPNLTPQGTSFACATSGGPHRNCNHICPNN